MDQAARLVYCMQCTDDDESMTRSCYSDVNLVLISDKSEILSSPVVTGMSIDLSLW